MGFDLLGIAVGAIFIFLAVCLVASAGTEGLASVLSWRANLLLEGIKTMLNDPSFSGLALRVYNHALVNPVSSGNATSPAQVKFKPNYIDPQHFANALMDILGLARPRLDEILGSIDRNVHDAQLQELFRGIANRNNGDPDRMRNEIADWFRRAAAEISGAYKRRTMLSSFVFGLILSALLDIEPLRTASGAGASGGARWLEMLGGWIITATSTLYGAPFWFDLLQKLTRVRGTGPPPEVPGQTPSQPALGGPPILPPGGLSG